MPKLFLPPQGGEKWLCIFTFLFMMFSVLCTVIIIYCIVIIYIPSLKENGTEFVGPKRCTTTNIERNLTKADPTDTICNWASCEEWCLSKGSSPCSKMYGILRDVGATLKFEDCDFSEENGFIDHICSTAENLEELNCKRSKFETTEPGHRETCMEFNNLISCEAGVCKNISHVWKCSYQDPLSDLLEDYGSAKQLKGWCNCRLCPESNTSLPDSCPKETEYCFLEGANPATYDEKRKELCKNPSCQGCYDLCAERHQCLDMRNRRDVVYFGVDEYDDPLLTYYKCDKGNCTEIYDMKCTRACDAKEFDFNRANIALMQRERILMAQCGEKKIQTARGMDVLPNSPRGYQQLLASCSNITYHKYNENGNTGYIEATDCVNGTWFQNGEMARVDYETLLVNYERYRSDRSRMVVSSSADQVSLIPWEEDITILNDTRIMINQEGCVNTLSMECMDFYYRYGRDGANYTSRAIFDCYYNEMDNSSAILDYQPKRTFFFLILWSVLPGSIMILSCVYMCICSKFMFIGDDGHMRIFCCGKAVTGIGEVAVYKPQVKSKS